MRKVNVYKFSEKMPDEGVTIVIIPKSDHAYNGRLVDKIKVCQQRIEESDHDWYKQELQVRIKKMQETGRHLMIEWDDDFGDIGDIYVNGIMDWEWMEVDECEK